MTFIRPNSDSEAPEQTGELSQEADESRWSMRVGREQKQIRNSPPRGKTKHLQADLNEGTYIVFDIETTGGNPEKNGITEIFALEKTKACALTTSW